MGNFKISSTFFYQVIWYIAWIMNRNNTFLKNVLSTYVKLKNCINHINISCGWMKDKLFAINGANKLF